MRHHKLHLYLFLSRSLAQYGVDIVYLQGWIWIRSSSYGPYRFQSISWIHSKPFLGLKSQNSNVSFLKISNTQSALGKSRHAKLITFLSNRPKIISIHILSVTTFWTSASSNFVSFFSLKYWMISYRHKYSFILWWLAVLMTGQPIGSLHGAFKGKPGIEHCLHLSSPIEWHSPLVLLIPSTCISLCKALYTVQRLATEFHPPGEVTSSQHQNSIVLSTQRTKFCVLSFSMISH